MGKHRLTDNLVTRVMQLPEADKRTLVDYIKGTLAPKPSLIVSPQSRFAVLADAVRKAYGIDLRERSKMQPLPWCKAAAVWIMRTEGYRYCDIAHEMRAHPATVYHCRQRMETAFSLPNVYRQEIEIYNKINNYATIEIHT